MPASGTASEVAPATENAMMNEAAGRRGLRRAEQGGLGQRIAQQPLQRSAGEAERGADQEREHGARQADVAYDHSRRPLAVEQPGEHRLGREPGRTRPSTRGSANTTMSAGKPRFEPPTTSPRRFHVHPSGRPSYILPACGGTGMHDDSGMTRLYSPRPLQFVLALLCALAAAGSPASADPPRRVVSFNVCADQLVVALADPGQIAGLSPYATDPTLSAVAEQARAFRKVQWHAESVVPLDPDLVLVGPRDRSVTQRLLGALGFRVVGVDFVSTIAAAREQIRAVAALLGHPERGERLLARLDAAQARLATVPRPRASTALLIGHGGYTEGPTSLAAGLIAEAGLKPPPGAPAGMGGFECRSKAW